ncbi:MAG TPA: hypothetical protein VFN08_02040, partial [Gemmatimonadales bacterium]|nr:hypothetical protein [Gemmatimonadales bacterium]
MSIVAVAVRRWATFLAGRPFGQRVRLLPIGATIAMALILSLSIALGYFNTWRLRQIERDYYPSVNDSKAMSETLGALQIALQNAVAAQDTDRLASTDSLRQVFRAQAQSFASHGHATAADGELSARFDRYYSTARRTSYLLITGATGDSVSRAVTTMVGDYKAMREAVAANIASDEAGIAAAFRSAKRSQ